MVDVDDLDALRIPRFAKVAGGLNLVLGAFQCILAAQIWAVLRWSMRLPIVLVMLLAGLVAFYAGYRITRGVGRMALVAVINAGLCFLLDLAWMVFSLTLGLLSPLTLLLISLSVASLVCAAIVKKDLYRVDSARVRLREQGLDTGL